MSDVQVTETYESLEVALMNKDKPIVAHSTSITNRGKVCNFVCWFVRANLWKYWTDFENSFSYVAVLSLSALGYKEGGERNRGQHIVTYKIIKLLKNLCVANKICVTQWPFNNILLRWGT